MKEIVKFFSRLSFWSTNSHKHIVMFGVLCLFIVVLQAQIRPKQLRKEVLQSQAAPLKSKVKGKKVKVVKQNPIATPLPLPTIVNPLANKKSTLVFLENSETLSFDKILLPDVQVLKGSVRFRHDNALLYCDSAYFYEKANSLDAFGNVRIVQGDTLFVYGDKLYYDGNTKLARLRHNVRMVNRKTTLTTDSLNYDRMGNLAYYYTGGKIVDELNTLTSFWGQYSPATKEALFKKKVHLLNKNFTLDSDTLKYNTNSSIANIVGPSHIVYNKETDIYSKRGWYNTASERMMLLDRSLVKQKDGKTMVGDTIFYDKKAKYGEGFSRVVLNDTIQKSTLIGYYVYYNELLEKGMATDSAMLVEWSTKDTMYVHADTLFTSKDSIYNVVRGFYNVRFFRNDVQGLCDSLTYSTRDSIVNMYHEPVLWAENNQLSGEYIQAITKNKTIKRIHIQRAAMAIQQEDSIYFNQLSGKEIIAHLDSGQLKKVNVNGNAETIYYPRDDKDSTLIGINKTQSSYVVMHLKNKKVERIVMTSASNGNMYPLTQLSGSQLYLKNYFWLAEQRPVKREDIFLKFPKTDRVKLGNSNLDENKKEKKEEVKPTPNKVIPKKTIPEVKTKNTFTNGME
ncbi:MAG: OstA-like protein [Paludibacter sp.]